MRKYIFIRECYGIKKGEIGEIVNVSSRDTVEVNGRYQFDLNSDIGRYHGKEITGEYLFSKDFKKENGMYIKKNERAYICKNNVNYSHVFTKNGDWVFDLDSPNGREYGKEVEKMNKSGLKSGMVVEFMNGDMMTVIENGRDKLIFNDEDYSNLAFWREDLTHENNRSYTIVKVYNPASEDCMPDNYDDIDEHDLIWVRKSERKFSLCEIMEKYREVGKCIYIMQEDKNEYEDMDEVIEELASNEMSYNLPQLFKEKVYYVKNEEYFREE